MKILLREELRTLMEKPGGPAASIYMPTQRGPDTLQGPVRLDNLLRQAEQQLVKAGLRAVEARRWLQPARDLERDAEFWRGQANGLALFLAERQFRYYRLPYSFPELVIVAERFHVKPLLELFFGDRRYYILAVSQNRVRLLQCSRDGLRLITPAGVPTSLEEAMRYDVPGKQTVFHTGTGGGRDVGGRHTRLAPMFHTAGGETAFSKEDISHFFQMIDHGLHELLSEEEAPMVLAAVDYLHPLYREANTYPNLLSQGIEGNPDELSDLDLQRQGLAKARPYFDNEQASAARLFIDLEGTGRATNEVAPAVLAAKDGNVFKMFVAVNTQIWGKFDPEKRTVAIHNVPEPGDEDLLEVATAHTLLTRGAVYAVAAEKVPGAPPIAAVLRYPGPVATS